MESHCLPQSQKADNPSLSLLDGKITEMSKMTILMKKLSSILTIVSPVTKSSPLKDVKNSKLLIGNLLCITTPCMVLICQVPCLMMP